MKLFKTILEMHKPHNTVETIEVEDDKGTDVGNFAAYTYSFDITERDSDREYHERQVDVDDFETTPDYSETQDGRIVKVTVYMDSRKHNAFYIDFQTNFFASKYFDCTENGSGTFDASELRNHAIRDLDKELSSDEEQYVVQLAKSHLHKTLPTTFKKILCVEGTEEITRRDDDYDPSDRDDVW